MWNKRKWKKREVINDDEERGEKREPKKDILMGSLEVAEVWHAAADDGEEKPEMVGEEMVKK